MKPRPAPPSRAVVIPRGTIKHIWVDTRALADGKPAWIIEEATGLCRRHRAATFAVAGDMVGCGDATAPLHEGGPAMWLETDGEVRFFP